MSDVHSLNLGLCCLCAVRKKWLSTNQSYGLKGNSINFT